MRRHHFGLIVGIVRGASPPSTTAVLIDDNDELDILLISLRIGEFFMSFERIFYTYSIYIIDTF